MTLELRACLIWSYWEILSSTTLNTRAAAQTLCRKFATYYHQDGAHRYSPSMGLRLLTFLTRFSACRKRAPISYSVLGVTTGVGALKNIFEAQYPARPYPCLRFAAVLTTSNAKLGARMDRFLLSCEILSYSTSCRFSPAHP